MGNLFSVKLAAPPPRHHSHKRKQRGLSITSATTILSMSNSKTLPAIPYDADVNLPTSRSAMSSISYLNGSVSSNGASSAHANSKTRRASLKMTLKRAYSSASASSNVFTDERRQIIQTTWKEITDKTGKLQAALDIFQNIFETCPEVKKMFCVNGENLETSAGFVRHARVFANVLDLAVRNVFELETEIGPILTMFGRRHFFKHQIGFRNEYLTVFAQSISDFISRNLSESFIQNPEAAAGWRLFISYIIYKLKEGYDSECINARKNSALIY